MKTEEIINPNDKEMLDAINMTSEVWFEMPLPDHPTFPQFSRKLVVTGFSNPDMEDLDEVFFSDDEQPEVKEDRIYVFVRQILTTKETNKPYKSKKMKSWEIFEWNTEEVLRADGSVMTTVFQTTDDEGNVISSNEMPKKVPSIQYVRFLINTKSVHLADILARFMIQYVEKFKSEINAI